MHELPAVTPLTHDPGNSQTRFANYNTRVLDVAIGLLIENDITRENTLNINILIVIFFENSADVIRVNAGAPRCKNKPMAVVESGRRATENGLRIIIAELMVRVHKHRRYPVRPPVRNAGACSGLHHNGLFLFFYCSLHVSTVANRHGERQRHLGPGRLIMTTPGRRTSYWIVADEPQQGNWNRILGLPVPVPVRYSLQTVPLNHSFVWPVPVRKLATC